MAGTVTARLTELFCRAAKRALEWLPECWLNNDMQIRSKLESDIDHDAARIEPEGAGPPFDGAPVRGSIASRDIIAALLLTVAAALFIGAAATSTTAPDAARIQAAEGAGGANP